MDGTNLWLSAALVIVLIVLGLPAFLLILGIMLGLKYFFGWLAACPECGEKMVQDLDSRTATCRACGNVERS